MDKAHTNIWIITTNIYTVPKRPPFNRTIPTE